MLRTHLIVHMAGRVATTIHLTACRVRAPHARGELASAWVQVPTLLGRAGQPTQNRIDPMRVT